MPLIKLENVTKEYSLGETVIHALRGIDLEIEEREFTVIWGPSGSGKTTLLNLIGTIDTPSTGHVYIKNNQINVMTDDTRTELRNKTIGFVFQKFNLIPVLTAFENVLLPLQILGIPESEANKRVMKCLEEVSISDLANHRPDKLSGGQQQRVAIARALVTNPSIVIADEPTANLDSVTAMNTINLMKKLNKNDKITFIFSTHDQRLIDQTNRLIRLEDGKIIDGRKKTNEKLVKNRTKKYNKK